MNYINVGKENSCNIDLYYEDHGTGKPVVLIHGWPLSGDSWEKQIPALIDAGYHVITYDRRGFGKSSRPFSGYNYDTMAEDLHKVITKLNLRDATLVGFSMGGGEVARYIGKYGPDRVSRAVFISAIPPYLLKTPDNPEGLDQGLFDGFMNAIAVDRPAFLSKFLSDFYNVDILKDKGIGDDAIHLSWNVGVSASSKATRDCVQCWLTDFRDDLRRINMPTLIIHGDADRICPIAITGQRTAEFITGSNFYIVRGGPHGLNWTHADEVNRELVNFLRQEKAVGKQTAKVGA